MLRRELTPIRMRPACVDSYRTSPVVGVIIQSVILMMILALQFHSHFHQVGAHLIPNYKTPHVVPLVMIWIVGVFANILPFLTHGVPLLAGMGLGLLPWAILCGLGSVGPAAASNHNINEQIGPALDFFGDAGLGRRITSDSSMESLHD